MEKKIKEGLFEVTTEEVMPIRREVLYPGKAAGFSRVEGDEQAQHLGWWSEGELVSVISLFESDRYGHSLQFRKFATRVPEQGKGYGSNLLKSVIELARQKGYPVLWCNARLSAVDWYARFGFMQEGTAWKKNEIDYIILYKAIQ